MTLGHASARPAPDVPLLADVSRLHAALQRDAEGYALEAFRTTQVNGQEVERAHAPLRRPHHARRPSCQLVFTQPVPVSASARLDLVSGHRLAYPVSAILLMADTLVLRRRHARPRDACRDLAQPIILLPHRGRPWRCGTTARSLVDGPARARGRAPLEPGRTVTVGDVSHYVGSV